MFAASWITRPYASSEKLISFGYRTGNCLLVKGEVFNTNINFIKSISRKSHRDIAINMVVSQTPLQRDDYKIVFVGKSF